MVTGEINKLSEATNILSTCSTSSPLPGSVFIRTTLIVPYVGVIGFENKRKSEGKVQNVYIRKRSEVSGCN